MQQQLIICVKFKKVNDCLIWMQSIWIKIEISALKHLHLIIIKIEIELK